MPLFILMAEDKPDSLELRRQTREAHLDYIASFGTQVRLGGPVLKGPEETPTGSVLILDMATLADAEAFAASDPYTKAGLFQRVVISPYKIAIDNWA